MIGDAALSRAFEESWPAAEYREAGGFRIGRGFGGGGRISSARALPGWTAAGIDMAAAVHREWGQPVLFRAPDSDAALAGALTGAGLHPALPTAVMEIPTTALTDREIPFLTAIPCWPPLAVQREIWEAGNITPARQAAMARVDLPRVALLGRLNDAPVASAFMARAGEVAMIHAIEVAPQARRQGMAEWLLRAAAELAADQGATRLALAVTLANQPAVALYRKLGFATAGTYRYWS